MQLNLNVYEILHYILEYIMFYEIIVIVKSKM